MAHQYSRWLTISERFESGIYYDPDDKADDEFNVVADADMDAANDRNVEVMEDA